MYKIIISSILLAIFCVSSINCQCPNPPTVANFSLSQYLGTWYEIQRFPLENENNLKCVVAQYTLLNATLVRVNNSGINEKTNAFEFALGQAVVPDPKEPSKLLVSFSFGPITVTSNYWVLLTDYPGYSLVYSCRVSLGIKNEFAWILSRTRTLDPAIVTKLRNYLQSQGVDPNKFSITDQTKCE